MHLKLEPVPPPERAPVQEAAKNLGLLPGLRVFETENQFRCVDCGRMARDWIVWVPDGVRRGDPDWSIIEKCRKNFFNGHSSGWCLGCAQKLGKSDPEPLEADALISAAVASAPIGENLKTRTAEADPWPAGSALVWIAFAAILIALAAALLFS